MKTVIYFCIAVLISHFSLPALGDIHVTLKRLDHPLVIYGVMELEERIRTIDTDYRPMLADLATDQIAYSASYAYLFEDRALAAIISVKEGDGKHNRIYILMDPFTDESNLKPSFGLKAKFRTLEHFFSSPIAYEVLQQSNFQYFIPQGDFLTQAYIATYLRLKGFQNINLLAREGDYSFRIVEGRSIDVERFLPGLPLYAAVLTKSTELIDLAVSTEIKAQSGSKVHYELAVLLSDVDPNVCKTLF